MTEIIEKIYHIFKEQNELQYKIVLLLLLVMYVI